MCFYNLYLKNICVIKNEIQFILNKIIKLMNIFKKKSSKFFNKEKYTKQRKG